MAGIYVHVPFCKSKCFYCDFYSETSNFEETEYFNAICKEIDFRKDFFSGESIETLYFGGGTPSLLHPDVLQKIINYCRTTFPVTPVPEITIEVNPDDIDKKYIKYLKNTEINRISIGVQSFFDEDLKFMNRRHSGKQAKDVIEIFLEANYDNLSIDLIYGMPKNIEDKTDKNLEILFSYPIHHLSAYHLGIEENTVFGEMKKNRLISEIDEEKSFEIFSNLGRRTGEKGFRQYEISNFAKNNMVSKHNSSYWEQKKYLGLGPSAHSFDSEQRYWNTSHYLNYLTGINSGLMFYESEKLSFRDRYNEYIMTSLRTDEGIDLTFLKKTFGQKLNEHCFKRSEKFMKSEFIELKNNYLILTMRGKFISNTIIEDLFFI